MPATVLGPQQLLDYLSSGAYIQTRYKKNGSEAALYKFCKAIAEGFFDESGEAINLLEPQRFDLTAEQGFLDNRARFWNVPRIANEQDQALRLRIGQVKLRKWGAFNVDEMLNLLAALLLTDVSHINFSENDAEDGAFEPALIAFAISPEVFDQAGITDIPTAILNLEAAMDAVAPAGVRVYLVSQGTALWDDPGTVWDQSGLWSGETDSTGTPPPPEPSAPSSGGGIGDGPIGEDPIG